MQVPSVFRRSVPLVLALALMVSAGAYAAGPTRAQAAPGGLDRVVEVAINGCSFLVQRAGGTVWGWGCNSDWSAGATAPNDAIVAVAPMQAEGLDQVHDIAFGYSHALAVRADGTVWAWGRNDHGQVGTPPGAPCPHHPWACVKAPIRVPGLSGVMAVAATDFSSFALTADGALYAWGANGDGELGTGDTMDRSSPIQVAGLPDLMQVSGAATNVIALGGDGTVWTWGSPKQQTTPMPVPGLEGVVEVSAGLIRNLARDADGAVWAWGERGNPTPVAVAGLGPVTTIAGGTLQSAAVAADGTVWVWGAATFGAPALPPTLVTNLSNIVGIAMGSEGNLALLADGTVWRWTPNAMPQPAPAPAGTPPAP